MWDIWRSDDKLVDDNVLVIYIYKNVTASLYTSGP
jgi:hypothetical protein